MESLHITKSYYTRDEYIRDATIRRIVDGDTFEVVVDCGFRRYSVERLRLADVDAPEIRGANKEEGFIAKAFVEDLLPVGAKITFRSVRMDSFGRWIAHVYYYEDDEQKSLGDLLLNEGLGVEM